MPVADGDAVPTPILTENEWVGRDKSSRISVTIKSPLYWDWFAPVNLTFWSTASPCAFEEVTVAIPEVWS